MKRVFDDKVITAFPYDRLAFDLCIESTQKTKQFHR
jgi:hypothetical protein